MRAGGDKSLMIDLLRGLAAVAVCWSHYGGDLFPAEMRWVAGRTGVVLFFAISGYIIPASMARSDYRWADAGRFLLRRAARLYPALLAAIALVVVIAWCKLALGRAASLPTWTQVAANVTLLPRAWGEDHLVSVFWTLTVEGQYYLLIALIFPWLHASGPVIRRVLLGALCVAPLLGWKQVEIVPWLPAFAVGIGLWLRRAGLLAWSELAVLAVGAFGLLGWREGIATALASFATCALLLIGLPSRLSGLAVWCGAISYPLYLFHVPIGGELSERLWRWLGWSPFGLLAQTLVIHVVCIGVAWIVYRTIDIHALALTRRLPATSRGRAPTPALANS